MTSDLRSLISDFGNAIEGIVCRGSWTAVSGQLRKSGPATPPQTSLPGHPDSRSAHALLFSSQLLYWNHLILRDKHDLHQTFAV